MSRGTKLWQEPRLHARTLGMPNNEGMRRQAQPGEVGGAKVTSTELR